MSGRRASGVPRPTTGIAASLVVALALLGGCRAAPAGERTPDSEAEDGDRRAVEAMLAELYRAFGFPPGGGADWDAIRALCADGAVFVAPIAAGEPPRAVGIDAFLDDFRSWVATEPVRTTGLEERVLHARIEAFGTIAHAWVAFEGYVPATGERRTRGVDAIGLVRDGARWELVSFATQYESPELAMPARFLGPVSR